MRFFKMKTIQIFASVCLCFLTMMGFSQEDFDLKCLKEQESLLPVAVIGSGPSGIAAAFVTAKEKHATVVFEGPRPGGPLNDDTGIGNWPGILDGYGKEVMRLFYEQAKAKGVMFSADTIQKVDFSRWPFVLETQNGRKVHALSVIVATGAIPKKLGVLGEEECWDCGVATYVYKKDAAQFSGKSVAVVGSGVDAFTKACLVAPHAKEVFMIARGPKLQKAAWVKKIREKGLSNIKILYNTQVQKMIGNGQKILGLEMVSEDKPLCIAIDAVILGIGIAPNTEMFKGQLPCDAQGYIELEGRTQATKIQGVFAAGNATDKRYRQAAISIGDGMKAGYDAVDFLKRLHYQEDHDFKNLSLFQP